MKASRDASAAAAPPLTHRYPEYSSYSVPRKGERASRLPG